MTADEPLDELRPCAFAIAYRMLGSVGDAEDVVQEALLRLHRARADGERIESPRAYVSTIVTRLAIDQLRSARVRREQYVGEWLPEPLVAVEGDDPAERTELADSLSFAFLVLLESLTPEQRAVFLLREVFDYPYDEVARIVGKSEDNARQLATRARRAVEARRPRFEPARRRRPRDQRDDARDRRRPHPRRPLGRQPRQARSPRPRRRHGRAAARRLAASVCVDMPKGTGAAWGRNPRRPYSQRSGSGSR